MKSILQIIIIVTCLYPCCILHAQITVVENGNVGIGISDPISKIAVNDPGDTNTAAYFSNTSLTSGAYALKAFTLTPEPAYSGGSEYVSLGSTISSGYGTSRGIIGSSFNEDSQSNGRAFGLYGLAGNATNGFNYGVFGILSGSNQGAAIYGTTDAYEEYTGGYFAGYFKGAVYVSNCISVGNNNSSISILYQNAPNPFNVSTVIQYFIPNDSKKAIIYIFNMQGGLIAQKTLTSIGNGSIEINGSELKAGMYIYTLVVDGKEVDTKRMILTE